MYVCIRMSHSSQVVKSSLTAASTASAPSLPCADDVDVPPRVAKDGAEPGPDQEWVSADETADVPRFSRSYRGALGREDSDVGPASAPEAARPAAAAEARRGTPCMPAIPWPAAWPEALVGGRGRLPFGRALMSTWVAYLDRTAPGGRGAARRVRRIRMMLIGGRRPGEVGRGGAAAISSLTAAGIRHAGG